VAAALLGLAFGCGPSIGDETGSSTTAQSESSTGTTTSTADTTTSGSTSTSTFGGQTETGDDVETSVGSAGFIYGSPDGGGVTIECDVWEQDCPETDKCMPWDHEGGDGWSATRCTANFNEASIGEPCTAEGSFASGIDTCERSAICLGTDVETFEGTCFEMCTGSAAQPVCTQTPNATCLMIDGDDVLPICRPICDPLLADCPDGQACLPGPEAWGCMFVRDAQPGDVCDRDAACTAGSVCAADEAACGGDDSCCIELCDLEAVDAPCSDGTQVCVPYYDEGTEPEGYATVGFCRPPA